MNGQPVATSNASLLLSLRAGGGIPSRLSEEWCFRRHPRYLWASESWPCQAYSDPLTEHAQFGTGKTLLATFPHSESNSQMQPKLGAQRKRDHNATCLAPNSLRPEFGITSRPLWPPIPRYPPSLPAHSRSGRGTGTAPHLRTSSLPPPPQSLVPACHRDGLNLATSHYPQCVALCRRT